SDAVRPSIVTLPSRISAWMRLRDNCCANRAASQRSSRTPASAASTHSPFIAAPASLSEALIHASRKTSMVASDQDDEEKPLDPAVERVRRRLLRFMVINLTLLFVVFLVVL